MEWYQLEYFRTVADLEHMTKAADKLSVSQPALSRAISKLEVELGAPLFDRQGRSIKLNRYGQLFREKVEKAMDVIIEGKQEVQDMISPDKGEISVGFLHTLGNELIPELLAVYRKKYPDIRFQLFQNAPEILLKKLLKGEVDLCLTSPPIHHPDVNWDHLLLESLYICVPKGHPYADQESVSFFQLQGEDFICMKKGFSLRSIFDRLSDKAGFDPDIVFEGEEVATLAGLVAAGLGIALIPKTKDIDPNRMALIEINDLTCQRKIGLASRKAKYISPAVEGFKKFVIDYCKAAT
ncbi:LysR family transcriptional regulator [Scopulibacillus cellulosilyticus]|uniref:LysR family transcriptional regulator n=1 Tax=Scopulibacillus cellulosilyticus TaxID=2665665 RepID=A0ABW2PTM9_9BACL